jgi:hypothetical protein
MMPTRGSNDVKFTGLKRQTKLLSVAQTVEQRCNPIQYPYFQNAFHFVILHTSQTLMFIIPDQQIARQELRENLKSFKKIHFY